MSVSVNEVMQIVRVTSAVVSELGLVQYGVRADGRNVGFAFAGTTPDESPILFSVDKNALIYDDEMLTSRQRHLLIGIAVELELDWYTYPDLLEAV